MAEESEIMSVQRERERDGTRQRGRTGWLEEARKESSVLTLIQPEKGKVSGKFSTFSPQNLPHQTDSFTKKICLVLSVFLFHQ